PNDRSQPTRSSLVSAIVDTEGRRGFALPALGHDLTKASGIGLGVSMIWFSLLVLLPLAAVVVTASETGWGGFWSVVTNEQTAAAIRLTVTAAAGVTLLNVFTGTAIAWVLVRDKFF